MSKKILIFFFLFALCSSNLYCQPRSFSAEIADKVVRQLRSFGLWTEVNVSTPTSTGDSNSLKKQSLPATLPKKKSLKNVKVKEEVKQAPKTKAEILKPIEIAETAVIAPRENTLARALGAITINTARGPIIPFPVVDSNKDMGASFGIMPIMAVRSKDNKNIKAVLAPSATYNEYLKTTLTYRHYIFPDEKRLFLLRASYSQKVEKEFIIYYYTPQAWGSDIRVSAEAKNWVTGKPSFYGPGIESSQKDKANYALNMTGEEFTVDLPLIKNLFFNFNPFSSITPCSSPIPGS